MPAKETEYQRILREVKEQIDAEFGNKQPRVSIDAIIEYTLPSPEKT
jgi:hypothetical protein